MPEETIPLSDLQRLSLEWSMEHWPDGNIMRDALGLAEEVGEVCRAVLKRADGIRGTREEWTAELRKEMGDVLLILCKMAEREGFDLLAQAIDTYRRIKDRDVNHHPIGASRG